MHFQVFFVIEMISGRYLEESKVLVDEVMIRLSKYNVNMDKCKFAQSSVDYLGHKVGSLGIHATEKKVKVIKDTPEPQLRAYLRKIRM